MLIRNINYLNFDTFYNYIVKASHEGRNIGNSIIRLAKGTSLCFDMSLTRYEYIYLQEIATHVTPFTRKVINDETNMRNYNIARTNETSYGQLTQLIQEINDYTGIDYMDYYIPSGMFNGECSAVFSGDELLQILTDNPMNPIDFFLKAFKKGLTELEEDITVMRAKELFNSEEVTNYIISSFLNRFYNHIIDVAMKEEPLTDVFNNKYFIACSKTAGESDVQLMNITNDFEMINLRDDENKEILQKINEYRAMDMDTIVHESLSKYTLHNTYFQFSIESPFVIFEELSGLLPASAILYKETLNRASTFFKITDKDIVNTSVEKSGYANKLVIAYQRMLNDVINMLNNNKNLLKGLELTPSVSPYHYVIRLKLSDFDRYLVPYMNNDTSNYLHAQTIKVIKMMIRLSQTFYKTMIKKA